MIAKTFSATSLIVVIKSVQREYKKDESIKYAKLNSSL